MYVDVYIYIYIYIDIKNNGYYWIEIYAILYMFPSINL